MTKLIGIVNVTPDSFYDGGKHSCCEKAVAHGLKLIEDGADILDIGGESTWITSPNVPIEEERKRVIPVIKALKKQTNIPLSIDTKKPEIALEAMEEGALWINNISGFRDPKMRQVAKNTGAIACTMHMQGLSTQTMQQNPNYPNGVIKDTIAWLKHQTDQLLNEGINRENIVVDPGIGFGKTISDNYKILQKIHAFRSLGFPLLVGISRKSFIYKIIEKTPQSSETLAATLSLNSLLIQEGVEFIRVHDVKEHKRILKFLEN